MRRACTLLAVFAVVSCSDKAGVSTPDAGVADAPATDSTADLDLADAAACGAGVYPCGPYGTAVGDVMENRAWMGFTDPQNHCKANSDKLVDSAHWVEISLGDWYRGDVRPACAAYRKTLLWIIVAGGTGPDRRFIGKVEADYAQLDARVDVLTVMVDFSTGGGLYPSESVLRDWLNSTGQTFALAADPQSELTNQFAMAVLPYNIFVDLRTMTIAGTQPGGNLFEVGLKLQTLLKKL